MSDEDKKNIPEGKISAEISGEGYEGKLILSDNVHAFVKKMIGVPRKARWLSILVTGTVYLILSAISVWISYNWDLLNPYARGYFDALSAVIRGFLLFIVYRAVRPRIENYLYFGKKLKL